MNTEIVAKLKGELATLKSKVAFLEEITENAIHVEEHNGNYIVVKPEYLELDDIGCDDVHITTRLDGLEFDVEDDLTEWIFCLWTLKFIKIVLDLWFKMYYYIDKRQRNEANNKENEKC